MFSSAIGSLKESESLLTNETQAHLSQVLCDFLADKGYEAMALRAMLDDPGTAITLAHLIGHFIMRSPYASSSTILHRSILESLTVKEPSFTYTGAPAANQDIDRRIAEDNDRAGYRERIGIGAARFFSLHGFRLPSRWKLQKTPIVILGAGPAGILIARTLCNAGYTHLHILDRTGRYGGIWEQKNVRDGSKNNPFNFIYEALRVEAAPGPGYHITSFLHDLVSPPRAYGWSPLPAPHKATVLRVIPGDGIHQVYYRDASGEHMMEAPIMINCMGVGLPRPPSQEGLMTTDIPANAAGIRWQQILTADQARNYRGKTLVFVGLGNSTAEMLVQLQKYNEAGLGIHYKVLTHYPFDMIAAPDYRHDVGGHHVRLYREVRRSQLTHLAGDLQPIADVVEHLYKNRNEHLLTSVTHWNVEQNGEEKLMVVDTADGKTTRFAFDQLYTLIGYTHSKEELEALGMWITDGQTATIAYDYDGEIQRSPGAYGRTRLYPGYFGAGAILKTPQNLNAQVIPGILYRLPDLFFGIVVRSMEYAVHQRQMHAQERARQEHVLSRE